ncbi:spore coat protein [Natranaerobius trueperi]|uniref:spore coat protein n=1 Tax=Natranaerobius trueperi TaxID=759412 RepID=UPI001302FCB5|nr:spore coat protein [Natranaerobius trueperi]
MFQNNQNQQGNQKQKSQDQLADQAILHDMLMTEKHISSYYDVTVLESARPQIRQALQHIQQEEQQHAEEIYQAMEKRGWYN